jgi:hypothetical protein
VLDKINAGRHAGRHANVVAEGTIRLFRHAGRRAVTRANHIYVR